MDIPSKYNPKVVEDKWYKYWVDKGLFRSVPDKRQPYSIVIPPPNVTGVLHMGHMLNNSIQDILIRRARMLGKNACWVPGTDHASIATEARVVAKLKAEGIEKNDITREQFLDHAWEWKKKHGGIILEQLKKLGASCDWDRTKFTMDEDLSESVIRVFIDLFDKGLIYRAVRMVNWDPLAKTAVSDEEVVYREVASKLYYVRYRISGEDSYLTIATTRPETILGDTAVCVHPDDIRYHHLKGKHAVVPLVNRTIPIIQDDYVDMEFGTGCLKITPAHDINDYEIGIRHNLDVIDIFNDDGSLNEKAEVFVGKDRFEARNLAINKLEEVGLLEKTEDFVNHVGFSERTDAVIEPRLSMQWFLRMKELSKPALENVMNGQVRLLPDKFLNTYRYWMENIKDWCISRQLWWGHRIPVYYIKGGSEFVVAPDEQSALEKARELTGNDALQASELNQDEDVLDTWFSSWLWPISVFDGIRHPGNPDISYYYPTNDLITAPDILFFWVARMIVAGYEFMKEKPFTHVYLTGMVRDNKRRKMSKSLGNSPDPIELIDEYSADGVRVGMLLCSPAGNDLLFDKSLPEQGRNFTNKIWNAFRLIRSWNVESGTEQPAASRAAVYWFYEKLKQGIAEINDHFRQYRISDALMTVYKLFWDEYASWYLEIVKPGNKGPMDRQTYKSTLDMFKVLLKMLHPFVPFITEEIWQLLKPTASEASIMFESWPDNDVFDKDKLTRFEHVKEVVSFIRNTRAEKQISLKEKLELCIKPVRYKGDFNAIIQRMGNLSAISIVKDRVEGAASYITAEAEYFIPLGSLHDHEEELKKLRKELEYNRGFLLAVMKKLENRQFVENAPEPVLKKEQRKKADAETKIRALEERIESLEK